MRMIGPNDAVSGSYDIGCLDHFENTVGLVHLLDLPKV